MEALLVDPWLLAFSEGEDVDVYVQRLLDIYEAASNEFLELQITAATADLLELDGLYPLNGTLPNFWAQKSDIYQCVVGIVQRCSKIEDSDVSAILVCDAKVEPELSFKRSERHAEHVTDLLCLALVRASYRSNKPTPVLSQVAGGEAQVVVRAIAEVVECEDKSAELEGMCEGEVVVHSAVKAFFLALSPMLLAKSGLLVQAIALCLWQRAPENQTTPWDTQGWSVGASFVQSARACGLLVNDGRLQALLHCAAVVIMSIDQRRMHALRAGTGPEENQVIRRADQARAWRADIDDELHLHFWRCGDHVELANVVFHNNFEIAD